MKVRIIKKTRPDGKICFTIQQKHFLFKWLWVDAWMNSEDGAACVDTFSTFEEANANLWKFDGSKTRVEVVYEK